MYDKIIIGAGLYGLYAALYCGRKGERVLVLEKEDAAFCRATYINQARVHLGYHYPRSLSTAISTIRYFDRFVGVSGRTSVRFMRQAAAFPGHRRISLRSLRMLPEFHAGRFLSQSFSVTGCVTARS